VLGLSGKKIWQTTKGEYLVEPGNLLFVKKGANVVYQYFKEDFTAIFIFVSDEFIKSVIDKHSIRLKKKKTAKTDSVIYLESDETLKTYFQSLISYFLRTKPPSASFLKLKFEELILNLLTDELNSNLMQCLGEISYKGKVSIEEVMEENFTNNLKLQEFAKLSARSLSSFKRDFYELYKKSPGKWLIERRLDYSKLLLKNTNKNIEEIIYACGFKNRSHFIKAFKCRFGTTPLRFRLSKHPLKKSNMI
jgi:AraC-like DNA-binding protein